MRREGNAACRVVRSCASQRSQSVVLRHLVATQPCASRSYGHPPSREVFDTYDAGSSPACTRPAGRGRARLRIYRAEARKFWVIHTLPLGST